MITGEGLLLGASSSQSGGCEGLEMVCLEKELMSWPNFMGPHFGHFVLLKLRSFMLRVRFNLLRYLAHLHS